MIVTLDEIKMQERIDQDAEDDLLLLYAAAAEEYIVKVLNQDIPGTDGSPIDVPYPIKAACLLIIGDLYTNREGAGTEDIKENPAVMKLLYPYRVELGI